MQIVKFNQSNKQKQCVEGRSLSVYDTIFLNGHSCIRGTISFRCPDLVKTPKKLEAAYQQVIKANPILQCRAVVPEDEGAPYFSRKQQAKLSKLCILKGYSDNDLHEDAIQKTLEEERALKKLSPDEMQSVKMCALIGDTRVSIAAVASHAYLDGIAFGCALAQLLAYAGLPKFLWPLVRSVTPQEMPTLLEMTLKQNLPRIPSLEKLKAIEEKEMLFKEFSFGNPDLTAPNTANALKHVSHTFERHSDQAMALLRKELRTETGLTITSAFSALSVKTLAILLDWNDQNTDEKKPLRFTTPIDCRSLNKWGDKRDRRIRFPVMGNYAVGKDTAIPFLHALNDSLTDVGKTIDNEVNCFRSDISKQAAAATCFAPTNLLCGISSVKIPSTRASEKMTGITDLHFDVEMGIGPRPHCWFYVKTFEGYGTTIRCDIGLPISGLDKAQVFAALQRAASGTPLESLMVELQQ